MLCEGVPLMDGNRNDKKAETFDSFRCKIAFPFSLIGCLFELEKPRKEVIQSQEQAKRSLLKTQVKEVCHQLKALISKSLALGLLFDNMSTQLREKRTQLSDFNTELNIQKTDLDTLKVQLRARDAQVTAFIREESNLSKRLDWFNDRVAENISTQNTDFSSLRNHFAAWETAFTAFEAKVFEFKEDLDKSLLLQE
jgi:septation ring formation regulator EzrA